MASENNGANSDPATSFERALEQLERIVACLEEGQTPLSESLSHYEQGVRLLRQCADLLAQAERKIEVLAGFDAEDNPVTEPLADDAGETLEEKAANRSRRRSQAAPRTPKPKREIPLTEEDDIPF